MLRPANPPERRALEGRHVRVEPIDADRHAADLFAAGHDPALPGLWDSMAYGPFADAPTLQAWLRRHEEIDDPLLFAVVPRQRGQASGVAGFLRVKPPMASIEIGHIWFGRELRRTTAATEALFLMIDRAIEGWGYRRVEWKCDARNTSSRRAASRLGFRYEGLFRQHMIVKRRNRDTAWYAMLDRDWRALRTGYERWLAAENFDRDGRQRRSLGSLLSRADGRGCSGRETRESTRQVECRGGEA